MIPARPTASGRPPAPDEARHRPDYEPPRVSVLGTVAEITMGGDTSMQSDGFGAAGASGLI